ncbi:MAG: transglutaminase-like domain-containing protein [Isosphaeraceae bacterium]|nr:transglutaminase-like domain-containing protein [Isosphaeraceae bacterium]
MTWTRKSAWALILGAVAASSFCLLRYRQEQQWLAGKAQDIVGQANAQTRREKVMALRDYVRQHVSYRGVPQDGRPFLRDSAYETLKSGRGWCGEAARALVNLTARLGISGQRVNLYGRVNHVVTEVEIEPGTFALVDPQDNPDTNPYLDRKDWTLDEVIADPSSPFKDCSNLNLQRVPLLNAVVQRVRLRASWFTWTLENPWLILAQVFFLVFTLASLAMLLDKVLLRIYASRLGVSVSRGNAGSASPVAGRLWWSHCWRPFGPSHGSSEARDSTLRQPRG